MLENEDGKPQPICWMPDQIIYRLSTGISTNQAISMVSKNKTLTIMISQSGLLGGFAPDGRLAPPGDSGWAEVGK